MPESLTDMHRPAGCKTGFITTSPTSLLSFGFTADMIGSCLRAFIYVHAEGILVKWAQDVPRVKPTTESSTNSGGTVVPNENPPVVAIADGHGIPAGAEREIDGRRQLHLLRMISATANSAKVTITLEG